MTRKRTYSLEGKVVFSDSSIPKPYAIYSHDLQVFRSDRAFTSNWLGKEECNWNANSGTFRCWSLLPGTYSLYFDLSGGLSGSYGVPDQSAQLTYAVGAATTQPPLTVYLHTVPTPRPATEKKTPAGFFDLRKECDAAAAAGKAIQILAWGRERTGGACYYMQFTGDMQLAIPDGRYWVNAFEAAFAQSGPLSDRKAKLESLLAGRGVPVHVRAGEKTVLVLPALSTEDLIDTALESLRPEY